jgi:hypothetical protein
VQVLETTPFFYQTRSTTVVAVVLGVGGFDALDGARRVVVLTGAATDVGAIDSGCGDGVE